METFTAIGLKTREVQFLEFEKKNIPFKPGLLDEAIDHGWPISGKLWFRTHLPKSKLEMVFNSFRIENPETGEQFQAFRKSKDIS